MKKIIICSLLIVMAGTFFLSPGVAAAQDDAMPLYFRDTLIGAGIGAFIGGLVLLTANNKSDHWDYVAFGGLAGALGGLAYSVGSTSHAMVEMDKERITVGLPTLKVGGVDSSGLLGGKGFVMDLVQYRY